MPKRPSLLAVAALVTASAPAGCGDEEPIPPLTAPEPGPAAEAPATTQPAAEQPPGDEPDRPEGKPAGPAESGAGDPRVTELELEAARTLRSFVAALDARDGERACGLLAPGAIDELELPRSRGTCAASLEASIGYRDPRGLPVWEGADVRNLRSVTIDDGEGRVVATVVTQFADRDEPSIEDDVVYLTRAGGEWLVAKPSATLYRAIGAEAPPSALAPP